MFLHILQQTFENWRSPQTSHKHTPTNSPSIPGPEKPGFMCTREISHFKGIIVYLCCSSECFACFACLLVAAFRSCLPVVLPKSNWFLTGSELIVLVLRTTIRLQVEEFATTEFLLVEKVCVAFQTSVQMSCEPIRNKVCFPIAKYACITRCWCQKLTIRSSACWCSRLKFLRVLGYVIARKHNKDVFEK